MPNPKHFRSKAAYNRYVAHIHIHEIPHKTGVPVVIDGKRHVPKVSKRERMECPRGYCGRHRVVHI